MSTDPGCPLRENCVAYQNPSLYINSVLTIRSILQPDFTASCDSLTPGQLESSHFCPLYDMNKQVVAELEGVRGGLAGMVDRVRGETETGSPLLRGE